MNRRDFVKTGTIAGATLLTNPVINIPSTKSYKLGYQLFSIRDKMAIDPIATIKRLNGIKWALWFF